MMKCNFSKFGKLLLCGAAVAMIGCSDFSQDIQELDSKIENLDSSSQTSYADLDAAIKALEAKLAADYATKKELSDLETTLNSEIDSQIKALEESVNKALDAKADKAYVDAAIKEASDAIAALESALATAKNELNAAIAANATGVAANKTAIEGAVARIEALEGNVADLKDAVAKVNEDLAAEVADLEASIAALEKSATESIAELKANDAALEAKIDALEEAYEKRCDEIAATVTACEKLIATETSDRIAGDEELQKQLDELSENIASLEESLALETEAREAEETAIYQQLEDALEAISACNNLISDLEKKMQNEDTQILQELDVLRSMILVNISSIAELEAGLGEVRDNLAAHIAAAEAYKESLETTIEELEGAINYNTECIVNLNGKVDLIDETIEDLKAQDDLIWEEIDYIRTVVTNLSGRLETVENELEAKFESLNSRIAIVEGNLKDLDASIAARFEAVETEINDLKTQASKMKDAIAGIEATIEDLEAMDEVLVEEIKNGDAAVKADLEEAREELWAQIEALHAAKDDLVARVDVLEGLVADNADDIKDNAALIEANAKDIVDAAKKLGNLEAYVNSVFASYAQINAALSAKDVELQQNIDAVSNTLAGVISRVGALEDAVKTIQALAETLATKEELGAATDELEKAINDVRDMLLTVIVAGEDRANDKIENLREVLAYTNDLLRKDIESILNRVQSIVYVPDYSDGKATLEYGKVGESILPKATVLRYLVNGGDNLAAEALVKAYTDAPKAFSYAAKEVLTRSEEYGLEILDVTADTENVGCILVKVRPYGFSNDFWQNVEGASSYSAALVFANEASNYSTAYTNFVAEKAEAIEQIRVGAKVTYLEGEEEKEKYVWEDVVEFTTPVASSDLTTEVKAYAPEYAFGVTVDGAEKFYTKAELNTLGYDIAGQILALYATDDDVAMRLEDMSLPITSVQNAYMKLTELPEGSDYSERVGKKVSTEYWLKRQSGFLRVKYIVDISNELVDVTMTSEPINWSVALAEQLGYDTETNTYPNILKVPVTFNIDDALEEVITDENVTSKTVTVNGNPLGGSNWKFYGWDAEKSSAVVYLRNYDFPAAGADENVYAIKITATHNDKDYTITGSITLNPLPADIEISLAKDLTLADDAFVADVDLKAAAYEKFQDISGYVKGSDEEKAAFEMAFANVDPSKDITKVNGNPAASNVNFRFEKGQVRYAYSQLATEGPNVIRAEFTPWFDIPFNFTVTSEKLITPTYSLVPQADFVDANNVVTLEGRIDETTNLYTIPNANLSSYFKVDKPEGEYELTVKFVATPAEGATGLAKTEFSTTVLDDDQSLALDINDPNGVLTWGKYSALDMKIAATIYANGYPVTEPYVITLQTEDPLTFTVEDETKDRITGGITTVDVMNQLSLTSSIEGTKKLLADATLNVVDGATVVTSAAADVYGASVTVKLNSIKLDVNDNGVADYEDTVYPRAKCDYDPTTGIITFIDSNDAVLLHDVIATFTATVEHNIHGVASHDQEFTVTFLKD